MAQAEAGAAEGETTGSALADAGGADDAQAEVKEVGGAESDDGSGDGGGGGGSGSGGGGGSLGQVAAVVTAAQAQVRWQRACQAEALTALQDGHEMLLGLLGRHCTCAWYRRAVESDNGEPNPNRSPSPSPNPNPNP